MSNHPLVAPTYLSKYTKVILRITKTPTGSARITSLNNPCQNNLPNGYFEITDISTGVFSLNVPSADKIFSMSADNHKSCFAISPFGYGRDYRFIKTELVQDNDVIIFTSYFADSSNKYQVVLANDIDITITLYYRDVSPRSVNDWHTSGFLALHLYDSEITDVTESNILGAYSNIPNLKVWADSKLSDTAQNHKDNSTTIKIYPPSVMQRGATVKGMSVYPATSNIYFNRRYNEITARLSHIYMHPITLENGDPGHYFYYCKSFVMNGFVFIELRKRPSRFFRNWRMKRFAR